MDSEVALALMRKAQLVFESEGTFLSFPLAAPAFASADLGFMSGGLTSQGLNGLREFSEHVDRIPRGPIAAPAEDDGLSGVYADILATAQLASSARTPVEAAQYEDTIGYLYQLGPDGLREDSVVTRTYKQYRDAWHSAQQDYNAKRIDAAFSGDPAAKRQWDEVDEPALREGLTELERNWNAKGFREAVEKARRIEESLGGRSPSMAWAEWRKGFNPDLDQLTDANTNQSFFPSGFSPSNVLDLGGWSRFTLAEQAVTALARDAPPELALRLEDQADLDIERLSFECTSLRVERSWLAPNVFGARFWKFADPSKVLSTGETPLAGSCPAYVTAIVLARNLAVTLKPRSARNDRTLERHRGIRPLTVGNFRLKPSASAAGGRPLLLAGVRAGPRIPVPPGLGEPGPTRATRSAVGPGRSLRRLSRVAFDTRLRQPILPPPTRVPHTPGDASVGAARDQVYVIAFICRRLPRCPNPDPGLSW